MGKEDDLKLLVRSGTALIVIESHEENRVVDMFTRLLVPGPNESHLSGTLKPLYKWSATDGLVRLDLEVADFGAEHREPELVLDHIARNRDPSIYLLLDFHPYLSDPLNVRRIREIALEHHERPHTVAMISPALKLPPELLPHAARIELSMPSDDVLEKLVREEAFRWSRRHDGRRVKVNRKSLAMLVQNLKGLALEDARRLARNAIYNDGAITEVDLESVMVEKFKILNRGGILHYAYDLIEFDDIAGLGRLKRWLRERQQVFVDGAEEYGLDPPKGVLLLGVQGCGKSLAAKAVASGFGVPLLRLDFGNLYNKYHGETERNLRESLRSAEVMQPCVLWIDEIEKGLSTSDSDSGTSKRVLGTLLTWMAERKGRVFLVATANDIEALPPELVRKGRFDEIFFVDLPKPDVRERIFEIHLTKRKQDAERIDLTRLAELSEGFSGAEIEQSVVSALYSAMADATELSTERIAEAISATRPLSVVMAERIAHLRRWASERCVPADD
ncbi:MAG: AAA family ATPase [Xanthomonadales bacterium]|nr:AAA family ATPase [Xanthomonadales bacterium]